MPRLAGRGREMSQLGGGIGTRGPGETQLETDRRKIARRIRHVKEQLEDVRRIRAQQRQRREAVPVATVALVGYTNAGKSTLFNALTKAGVLESAKMFATLDPTIRGVTLPSKRKVLMADTVGFSRNLPHTLVSAFRATLEEVQRAALILHVADAASPIAAEQAAQVEVVLGDAAEVARHPHWHGSVDALQVDLYDEEAAAPVLDSEDFYADCRKLLTADGCMSVNLFGRSSSFDATLGKIAAAFGADAVWAFRATREGNTVVLAQRTPTRPTRAELAQRAQTVQTLWGLPTAKWLRVLRPVQP